MIFVIFFNIFLTNYLGFYLTLLFLDFTCPNTKPKMEPTANQIMITAPSYICNEMKFGINQNGTWGIAKGKHSKPQESGRVKKYKHEIFREEKTSANIATIIPPFSQYGQYFQNLLDFM